MLWSQWDIRVALVSSRERQGHCLRDVVSSLSVRSELSSFAWDYCKQKSKNCMASQLLLDFDSLHSWGIGVQYLNSHGCQSALGK